MGIARDRAAGTPLPPADRRYGLIVGPAEEREVNLSGGRRESHRDPDHASPEIDSAHAQESPGVTR